MFTNGKNLTAKIPSSDFQVTALETPLLSQQAVTNGKNLTAKIPLGDFQVTALETPLLSQQAVTSKGISVSYTNLQLNP